MSLDQFEELVNKVVGADHQREHLKGHPFLKAAILEVAKENGIDPHNMPIILDLAERWYREYVLSGSGQDVSLAPTAMDFLAGDVLVRKLAPWVRDLREKGFGHSEPTFEGVMESADRIKQASAADLAGWREKGPERKEVIGKIRKLAREHLIELDFRSISLPYQEPGYKHVKSVPVIPSTYLYELAKETQSIAKHTGVAQDALVTHVLTGLKPIAPRARVKNLQHVLFRPGGERVFCRWAEVEFFAKDLTDKELKAVYNSVRRHVGKGSNRLTVWDQEFLQLVESMGGPPHRGEIKRFWEKFIEIWNSEPRDRHYPAQAWRHPKTRYKRLCERVNTSP